MPILVEFPLNSGGSVLVEVVDPEADGRVMRGLRFDSAGEEVVVPARRAFEQAAGRVQPTAQSPTEGLHCPLDVPDEVQVQVGLDLHAEAGAFMVSAGRVTNVAVTLTWRHREVTSGPDERAK